MKLGKLGQTVLSPAMIMGIIVSLIILAVGTYAFFTTQDMIGVDEKGQTTTTYENMTYDAVHNITDTGNQVFNVVGVVLVIGAIMLIVTMVYSYVKP